MFQKQDISRTKLKNWRNKGIKRKFRDTLRKSVRFNKIKGNWLTNINFPFKRSKTRRVTKRKNFIRYGTDVLTYLEGVSHKITKERDFQQQIVSLKI
jgi:hypothetical protein